MISIFPEIDLSKTPPTPQLYLCKPDRTIIGKLKEVYNINHKLNLNGQPNELSFNLPIEIDLNHTLKRNPHIDLIRFFYLIKLKQDNYEEWFLIDKLNDNVEEDSDYKSINCFSLQYELAYKKIRNYDVVSYNIQQVMNDVLTDILWTVNYVTPSILNTYRSFSINSKSVLDFILNDIVTTFNVIPIFNTIDRKISFYKEDQIGIDRGLKFSFSKYLQTLNKELNTENFCTLLKCFGKNNLSIQEVNPTGQNYLFSYSYFLYPYNEVNLGVTESGTTTTNITITNHGLNTLDYIVNKTRNHEIRQVTKIDENNVQITEITGQTSGDSIYKIMAHSDYMSNSLCSAILSYNSLLQSKDKIEDIAETGTTTTNLKLTAHGLIDNDYILNKIRNNEYRKITVVDSNNVTVASVEGQQSEDIIYKYKDGSFRKLLFQKRDLQTNLITKQNELTDLNNQKLIVLDNIGIQQENNTYTTYNFIYNGTTTTKTTNIDNTNEYVVMCKVSSITNLTVKLDTVTKTLPANTWSVLGKIANLTSTSVEISGTATSVDVKIVICKISDTEYTTTGNESTLINNYCLDNIQTQIDAKQIEINQTNTDITNKDTEIVNLKNQLSLTNNFTTTQLDELKQYNIENEWSNNNLVDSLDLYEAGIDEFIKKNIPQTIININVVNFLKCLTEQKNWDKLNLGDTVKIEYEKLNIDIKAKIVELEFDHENNDINLVIANVQEILNEKDKLLKKLYNSIHTTNSLNVNKDNWNNVATNFDTRNDRISIIPANPVIANDGTAIDHVINTDGSCDISFEWNFTGSGDAYNIDGFTIYIRSLATNEPYVFGSTIAKEQLYNVSADKRAFILYGVPSNQYYTFGVQTYRRVDEDINGSGILKSDIIKSAYIGEDPYLPSANVAFTGDVTGTINGVPATNIADTTAPTIGTINNPVANSDGSVTITWIGFSDIQSGIAGYNVWRAIDSTGTNKFIIGTVSSANNLTFTDFSTVHNTIYYYWVTCFDKAGNETVTPVSAWKQVTALNTNNPSAPSSISAIARLGKIDITWSNSVDNDVVAYRLEKSTNGINYSALTIINTNSYTEYNITETKENIANWKYRVKAIDIIGLESTTWTISNTPNTTVYFPADGDAPNTPNTPTGSSSYDGSITIQWTHTSPSVDLYKYRIYRSENNVDYYNIGDVDKATLKYVDAGLKNGQTYYYKISSIDYSGMESSLTFASSGLLATDQIAPTPPNPTATGDLGAIKLTWTEVSEKDVTYEVWRCNGGTWSDGSAVKIATVAGSPSGQGGQGIYVDYDPPIGIATTYTYKLKAVDIWGNISGFSTNSSSATSTIDFNGTIDGQPPIIMNEQLGSQIVGFKRNSVAYKQDGSQVVKNLPRYETGKFNQGVMVEEGTTNLLTANQASVETDLTGFGAWSQYTSHTFSRDTTTAWNGSASAKLVSNYAGTQPMLIDTGDASTSVSSSTVYTASVYTKTNTSGRTGMVKIVWKDASHIYISENSHTFTHTSTFQRVFVTATSPSNAVYAVVDITIENAQQNDALWADGLQLEQKPFAISWQLPGTPRAAEIMIIPTVGIFNKSNWTVEGTITPKIPTNVGSIDKTLFYCYIDASNYYRFILGWGGEWHLNVRSNAVDKIISGGSTSMGTTYSWMISGNGSVIRVCVNGAQIGSDLAYTEPIGTLPTYAYIGSDQNSVKQANGVIDNFRVSNCARTLTEHQIWWNNGSPIAFIVDTNTTMLMSFDNTLRQIDRNRLLHEQGTFTIADASTTKNPEKATHIVPSGWTSAQVIINQAISELLGGGKIVLLDGTYTVDGAIVLPSNVTLEGQGKSTVIKIKNLLDTDMYVITNDDKTNGNIQITLKDFAIDGNKIYNNYGDHWGVYLFKATNTTIKGLQANNCRYNGILLYSSSNNIITGNTCQGNLQEGISLINSSNNIITGNTCQGNYQDGIYLYSNSNNTVTGNNCQGNSRHGIYLEVSVNNTITGNTCQGNSYHGIYLFISMNNTITGNTCQGNYQDGIYLYTSSNNTITGNTCQGNSQMTNNTYDNIYISIYSDYNSIQSNVCRAGDLANKPRYGICISSITCNGNLVTNNDLYQSGVTGSLSDAGTGTITTAGNRL